MHYPTMANVLRRLPEEAQPWGRAVLDEASHFAEALLPPKEALTLEALRNAQRELAELAASETRRQPSGRIGCKKGCSACCAMTVSAVQFEVFLLAEAVAASGEASRLRAQIAQRAEAIRNAHGTVPGQAGMELRFDRRIPCGLLGADGSCSLYPLRPLTCRGENSVDASMCGPPRRIKTYDAVLWASNQLVQTAVERAIARRGLDCRPVELTLGLEIALKEPSSASRWLRGERPLSAAVQPGVIVQWQIAHDRMRKLNRRSLRVLS